MKQSQVQVVKEGFGTGGLTAFLKLIDDLVEERHVTMELCLRDEFPCLQGEIRGLRKLQKLFTKGDKVK